ncbi:MAG: propionyl-CoA carboxylase, partial [Deltaproteobacteria bacterium]|nr:propionyl-CoA carboxylase [Deltaproteobacteria bacterium]
MTNENRSFWINEEKKLAERVYQAMWPGGENAVQRLKKQGKQPVRELISKLIDSETEF